MSRKIFILGNCQTLPFAEYLKGIFPSDEITRSLFSERMGEEKLTQLISNISIADIVIGNSSARKFIDKENLSTSKFISIPNFHFSAFHPDYIAVRNADNKHLNANSAICAWAFKKGLHPEDVKSLFTKNTFNALGYLNRWSSSVKFLKDSFEGTHINFSSFYLSIKRKQNFMHTVNHPKIDVIELLAKNIAMEIEFDSSVFKKEYPNKDYLAGIIWPVYPYVSDELSLNGSYTWVINGEIVDGLDNFIEFSYRRLSTSCSNPSELRLMGVNESVHDSILSNIFYES